MDITPILAVCAPTLAVIVGFVLNRRKMQEIHVLVNSRLTSILAQLQAERIDNVRLKDLAGEEVSEAERKAAPLPPQ